MTRIDIMRALRAHGVPDALIGEAFGVTRQWVHQRLGPRPRPPRATPNYLGATLAPADQDTPLGDLLRAWRERRGYTQEEAAAALGIGTWSVSRWEQGCTAEHEGLVRLALYLLDKYVKVQ